MHMWSEVGNGCVAARDLTYLSAVSEVRGGVRARWGYS